VIALLRKSGLLLALAFLACGTPPAPPPAQIRAASPVTPPVADPPSAMALPLAVEQELERIGGSGPRFWPGFAPLAIPLALYDGQATWLFRHPHPPAEFGPGEGGARIADGRPDSLRANTGTEIAGIPTATLLLAGSRAARDWAALALHEAFHVFARQHHPGWEVDEMSLFVYPVEAREPLTLRREETQALRRSLAGLAAGNPESALCWADLALRLRSGRFGLLPAAAVAYERGTELGEGLATYVEGLARGETGMDLPGDDFPAEKVRDRAYAVGRAEAILLDGLDPAWKERLDRAAGSPPGPGSPGSLDEILATVLASRRGPRPCSLSAGEMAAAAQRAGEDLERLRRERESARAAFLARPGWTVVVSTAGEPLFPEKFDPLNVLLVGHGDVLHRRWLKLTNESAEFEILDREALTTAVGPHPLLQGVRRLTVTGLAEKPEVHERAGWARLEAPGFTAKLKSATIEVSHHELRIRLNR
jgi:hypothetical protein